MNLQNLQHKFYRSGLVEVYVLSGAEKLLVAQSVKLFPCALEPKYLLPYLSEAATLPFLQTNLFHTRTHTSHFLHIHRNIILSSILRCLKRFIPFRVCDWLITYLVSHQAASCPTNLTFYGFMVVIIFGEYYKFEAPCFAGFSVPPIRSNQISTVGSRFTTGLCSRIFGCKSNRLNRILFKWFKLR